MPEAKEKQDLKRIVIPMKPADGKGKTWWHRAGIAGRKDGKIWGRITSRPTVWDGYFILVDMDDDGGPANGAKAKTSNGNDSEAGPGPDEVPF